MDARDADPERVGAVVEAHTPDLLAYFLRRAEVPEDAADLLGDTLLVIWRRVDAIPADDREARMWMFGIARNVVATHGRTIRRRTSLQDKLRSQVRSVAPVEVEIEVDVDACLRRLDPIDQEIIRLTYWDGFSLKEAARLLELAEGTVRSRHHRARESLRRMLTDSDRRAPR